MTVKANWFAAEPPVSDDPFGAYAEQPSIPRAVEDVGHPIDLSAPEPRLRRRLIELMQQEGAFDSAGITCAIRARAETSCNACPIKGADPRIAGLCTVAVEQEQVLTTLAVHRSRGNSRA